MGYGRLEEVTESELFQPFLRFYEPPWFYSERPLPGCVFQPFLRFYPKELWLNSAIF